MQTWMKDKGIGKVQKGLDEMKRETEVNVKQEWIKFEELQKMKMQLKTDQLPKKKGIKRKESIKP